MKKLKYMLLMFIPLFFLLLTGCSKMSLSTTAKEYRADGLVAVVKGQAKDYDKLTYTVAGKTEKVDVNDNHFAISVPVSTKDQNVRIKATNGDKVETKLVKVKKAKALQDYLTFAQTYNYTLLSLGQPTDQLQLISKDGMFTHKKTDGTKWYYNVQNNQLMGIATKFSYKDLKSKTGQKNFATDLMITSKLLGADGKKVLKDFGKQTKNASKNSTKTSMSQITSNGVNFNINLSTKEFYLYITKY
ncbi:hypothetical protein [Companilactobacillus nantensis]|uniref:Lipoprotein n=1 Tax=Companilactobacillus nantensis DSM 16982 TaxID=1423774 RepID=A0A0R1WKX7_9LACO|nr:hypothetical protein [Companilactobacillus nantensis]KRM18415.1 hypothetical protein FD31_GL000961 [Companilactobacillus nantensis DSM 16982]GEO62983.1 hypothetical protein LNA01_01660 [Companilactobacillus nantensis]